MMIPHPTKIKSLILLIFVVFFQLSCEKDTDLLLEAVLLPEDTTEIENTTVADSTNSAETSKVADGYIVTVNGKDTNDGLTEATAWSLTHAFATAVAGDNVYIKAGNYGSLKLTSTRAGTSENPIKFIGYTRTPGDILATNGPTYTKANLISDGQSLPDNIMPHLENNPANLNPNNGEDAITINHSYIEIHNFMVSEYEIGYDIKASNVTVNNCIGFQFGNWDSKAIGWNDDSDGFDHTNRDGYSMRITNNSTNCTITNNLMVDGGMVNYFFIGGGSHKIDNNHGIALNSGNGSDYIFDFYNSSNNTITNTIAERSYSGSQGHRSRALIFQAVSDNNTVENFTGVNARLQLENARNNTLSNVTITGSGGENNGSVQVYGQSNNNIFKNLTIDGGGGIAFLGYDANEKQRTPVTSAGDNNFFINVKILNLNGSTGNGVISFHRLGNSSISGGTNYIIGLTADNFKWLINANRSGTINIYNATFSDGISTDINTFYSGWKDSRNNYTANFTNSNFAPSNKFNNPSGTKIISVPPLFTNESTKNYTVQSGSQLIGAGVNPSSIFSGFNVDLSNYLKPSGAVYNIGAYED
jgi:hypothetical protein